MYKWQVVFSIHENSNPAGPLGRQVGRSQIFEFETQYDNLSLVEEEARRLWQKASQVFDKLPGYEDGMILTSYPNIRSVKG